MTTVREKGFLLLFLLHTAYPEEHPGVPVPIFREEGGVIEMGYCFGVDYIAVFRSAPDGDQLLGNSSYEATPPSLPSDLEGRVNITNQGQLLGFQITHLRHSDTGLYRRECWQDNELANQHEHELSVCNEEVSNQKITLMEDGGAELLCNSSFIGGSVRATIQWYHDVFPEDKTTLFLDSSMSLVPLQEELQGVVEVRNGGASLHVPASVLKKSYTFYCLVMDGQRCLSFQNLDRPDSEETEAVFVSEGEKVVLTCPSKYISHDQRWETPLGLVNSTIESPIDQMYTVHGSESRNYSLVIHVLSANYSGIYSCYSPFLITEYSLFVCPRREPTGILFSDGEDVVLKCGPTQDESYSVQWYRMRGQEEGHLIANSEDKSIAIPEDLKGRVDLSKQDSSLQLSDLKPGDSGQYWCVVLWSADFLEDYADYTGGNDEEEYPEGEEENKDYLAEDYTDRCISKQVTHLTLRALEKEGRGITTHSLGHQPESDTTTGPTTVSTDTDSTVYAVCAVLGGLVVVGTIAAVVAIQRKNRRRASRTQGGAVIGYSGVKTEEKELKEDTGCTERLGQDEYTA